MADPRENRLQIPDENPFQSPPDEKSRENRPEAPQSVFMGAVVLLTVCNVALGLLAPGFAIGLGLLVTIPGLVNGYASMQRQMRFEETDAAEQWYRILLGFVQLVPLGIGAAIAMSIVGSLFAGLIDASSRHDTAIDEALGGFFSGSAAGLLVYYGGLIAMIRWKAKN